MKRPTLRSHARLLTASVTLAVVVATLAPGSWSTAVAQTGGGSDDGGSTPASAPTTPSPSSPSTPSTPGAPPPTIEIVAVPPPPPPTTPGAPAPVVAPQTDVVPPPPPRTTTTTPPPPATVTVSQAPGTVTVVNSLSAGLSLSVPAGATGEASGVTISPGANASSNPTGTQAQASIDQAFSAFNVPAVPDFVPNGGTGSESSREQVTVSVFQLDLSAPSPSAAAFPSRPSHEPGAGIALIGLKRTDVQGVSRVDGGAGQLAKEVTITLPITPEMLAFAGGIKSNIVLQYFEEETRQWSSTGVRQVLDPRPNAASFGISHFSTWALIVREPAPAFAVPATPAGTTPGQTTPPQRVVVPLPAKTGTGLLPFAQPASTPWVPVVLGALALSLLGGLVARRRG